jgi:hypothetical protein
MERFTATRFHRLNRGTTIADPDILQRASRHTHTLCHPRDSRSLSLPTERLSAPRFHVQVISAMTATHSENTSWSSAHLLSFFAFPLNLIPAT